MPDSIIDTGEKRINEAVCIDTKRIYDSCVSKDCLEDLRVTFYAPAQMLVDNAVTVKCRDCTIEAVSIDVDEVPFDNGFYSVDVTYYFKLTFDCYSAPCTVPMVATGYTSFNKKCILYGSSGNVKVFVSNVSAEALDCPEAPQYTNPSAKVQAVDPVILSMDVVCSCDCRVPCLTSMPKSITSTLDNSTLPERPAKAVLVTLGLFSIIQMVCRRICQFCINMGNGFPVSKVIRAQDHCSRHKMHRRTDHIIRIFYTDHIHIGIIAWDNWIGYFCHV